MYYLLIGSMASSSFAATETSRIMMPSQSFCKSSIKFKNAWSWRIAFALVCLTFAMVLVPESPQKLASICERHNPTIACQVW